MKGLKKGCKALFLLRNRYEIKLVVLLKVDKLLNIKLFRTCFSFLFTKYLI
ncbi:hypothetical protein BMETH_1630_0 [methanotrophic bacterial endosymbiont of Bathymodiolus sp.]|nr:hypothetical protein BMETH_1630_0 [methanotrophic bacterial endosymbiont of Bathymodiolus sp.]